MIKLFLMLLIMLSFGIDKLHAWVYPEHRDIAILAIRNLSEHHRNLLDKLWTEARKNYENRLSEKVIDTLQSLKPTHLDYASWPAISGDHSCSAKNMLDVVLRTDWILDVADINAQLKIDLAAATNRDMRINALRKSDINLQKADPEYVTRAGSNNVHFLLSLPNIYVESDEYFRICLREEVELNALGAYSWYHHSALTKISQLPTQSLSDAERSLLILAAFADEAFALHFLEDVFAAGHVAGSWGDASQRKGTHDYYNEMGLKTSTWNGKSVILVGDAWMRYEDGYNTSILIKKSLEQLLDASVGKQNNLQILGGINSFTPASFNICTDNFMPYLEIDSKIMEILTPILSDTPIPGLDTGLGKLPRFRAELGMFIGFTPALRGSIISRGFGETQETFGLIGGIEASARFGIGLDGVLNESGDGLAFLEIGWRQDGSSSTGIVNDPGTQSYGNLLSAIPGRSAFGGRLRIPFYLIPGDLLVVSPFLFFLSSETLIKMGATAVNGGLIPWQAGIATPVGRVQFVLGREIGIYLFGRTKERDALFNISPDKNGISTIYILSYRSTQLEFPILEYRPFRSFEMEQRSSLFVQLYGGMDIPHRVENISANAKSEKFTPSLKTIWYLGARVIFDWRHYF